MGRWSGQGKNGTGGTRPKMRREHENPRRAAFDAPPSLLALLQSTWAKRAHLSAWERAAIKSFLERVRTSPLTDKQLETAIEIGRSVAVGYDDPTLDEHPPAPVKDTRPRTVAGSAVLKVQRWGALPAKPPRKAVDA